MHGSQRYASYGAVSHVTPASGKSSWLEVPACRTRPRPRAAALPPLPVPFARRSRPAETIRVLVTDQVPPPVLRPIEAMMLGPGEEDTVVRLRGGGKESIHAGPLHCSHDRLSSVRSVGRGWSP